MKNSFQIRYVFLLFWAFLSLNSEAQTTYKDYPEFEKYTFTSPSGTLPYRLLRPMPYDAEKKYPLVIFFHGAGERGKDNLTPLTHIAGLFLNGANRRNYPCFVLVPQCPLDTRWVDTDWTLDGHQIPEKPSLPLQLSKELLEETIKNYPVDQQKVYVTGLSMGGFAVWDIIARYPDVFAAAIPICGGGDLQTAESIKNIPLWAFHGKQDQIVKPSRSREMIIAIRNAGGKPKYTEYPDAGHGSWKPAYEEPKLLEWLFAQKKDD
ncbi:MAG: prolyl oligopeptidase family serine peptidase [Microscillaceae bacterium]|nr:prolyl oligopeptidase family serine peptidase [Microscillaceae bacterium]